MPELGIISKHQITDAKATDPTVMTIAEQKIRITYIFTHHIRWVPFELVAKYTAYPMIKSQLYHS